MKKTNEICELIGRDVAACRKLRRMPSDDLAQRLGVSRQTISRLENGDPGVAIGYYINAAVVFGMSDVISNMFAPDKDPHALRLGRENLPDRIREPSPETSLGSLDF